MTVTENVAVPPTHADWLVGWVVMAGDALTVTVSEADLLVVPDAAKQVIK